MPEKKTSPVPARSDEEGDWIARQFFSAADLQATPEEYAARHAHLLGAYAFHLYRYRDPALAAWVRRVHEILSTEKEVELYRQRFLTPPELETLRKQAADDF